MLRPSLLLFALSAGCADDPALSRPTSVALTPTSHLGTIVTRNGSILIVRGQPGEPRFAVRAGDGRIVAADLSLADLRASHPALFDAYQGGLAARLLAE